MCFSYITSFTPFTWGSGPSVCEPWWAQHNRMKTLLVCLVFLLVVERSVSEFTAFENGMLSSSMKKGSYLLEKQFHRAFVLLIRSGWVLESQLHFPPFLSFQLNFQTISHWAINIFFRLQISARQLEFWPIQLSVKDITPHPDSEDFRAVKYLLLF